MTATFAAPAELKLMLPLADGMFTLLFPLLIVDTATVTPVNWLPLPMKNAPLTLPVVLILPLPVFNVPDTFTPVPVIVIVVLPAAAIVTLLFAVAIYTLLFPFANAPMKLLAFTLPLKLPVPDTFTPVPVIVITVLPTAAIVTFPLAVAMFTLLFPLLMLDTEAVIPVN